MGYWPTAQLVQDNRPLLELVAQVVTQGRPLDLPVPDGSSPTQFQFHVARVLKSAEVFPDELGGRYVHLRKAVSVHFGPNGITLKPKRAAAGAVDIGIAPQLAQLRAYTGRITMLEFPRDVDEAQLIQECAALGWRLATETRDETAGGVLYALERQVEVPQPAPRTTKDAYAKLGFRRD